VKWEKIDDNSALWVFTPIWKNGIKFFQNIKLLKKILLKCSYSADLLSFAEILFQLTFNKNLK
jgi:hypothetical protein